MKNKIFIEPYILDKVDDLYLCQENIKSAIEMLKDYIIKLDQQTMDVKKSIRSKVMTLEGYYYILVNCLFDNNLKIKKHLDSILKFIEGKLN